MTSNILLLDLETRSIVDLSNTNAWVYSEHPSTDVIVLAFKVYGSDEVKTWFPGEPVPDEFYNCSFFMAQNVQFELSMFLNVLIPRYNFPEKLGDFKRWIDVMQMAACHGVPRNLGDMCKFLNLPEQKQESGKALINIFSKPKKVNGDLIEWHDYTTDQFNEFVLYCKQDVVVMEPIYNIFKDTINWKLEQPVITLDLWQNMTGLPVDTATVDMLIQKLDEVKSKALDIAEKDFSVNPRSTKQMHEKLESMGCSLPNMQQDTIEEVLETSDNQELKKLLSLRAFMSKSSVSKFYALKERVDSSGHIRQWIKYFGAGTGRYSGRGFQPHNMPRSKTGVEQIDSIIAKFKTDSVPFWETMTEAKKILPGMIKAEEGKAFIVGDYAAIELRVIAWLTQQKQMIEAFRNGDDPYKIMAGKIFSKIAEEIDEIERQTGKVTMLSCQYGQGHVKFVDTHKKQAGFEITLDGSKRIVTTYRETYKEIPAFWRSAMDCFIKAVKNYKTEFKTHGCIFYATPGKLYIQLPSGRKLYYHNIKFNKAKNEWTCLNTFKGKGERKKLYGGLIVENIVQAIARDIMAFCMLELKEAELSPLLHVHDEVVCYEDLNNIEEKQATFDRIMNTPPEWFSGFPLKTESEICTRYHK